MSSRRARCRYRLRVVPILVGIASAAHAQVCAYVTNYESNTVSVIDTSRDLVVATIPVGHGPHGVAVIPARHAVYVTNFLSNTVSVIDTTTQQVVGTIAVGSGPSGVAATPDGSKLYVANYNSVSISVLDATNNVVTKTIAVSDLDCTDTIYCGLNGVTVNQSGTRAYVAGARRSDVGSQVRVVVINTATDSFAPKFINFGTVFFLGGLFPPGPFPVKVAVAPSGAPVYLTDEVMLELRAFDATASTQIGEIEESAIDIAVAPQGGSIYATHLSCDSVGTLEFCCGAVSVIDSALNNVTATIETTDCEPYDFGACFGCPEAARCFATGVATSPSGASVYVLDFHTGTVSVIDAAARRVVSQIAVGSGPMKIAVASVPGGCSGLPCPGDCDGDSSVSIDELITGVDIALGSQASGDCPAFDTNRDETVTIDEVIGAVGAALNGCS